MYFLPISFNTISTSGNSIRLSRRRIDMNAYVMINIFIHLTFTVTSYLSYFTHTFTRLLAKIYFGHYINVAIILYIYIAIIWVPGKIHEYSIDNNFLQKNSIIRQVYIAGHLWSQLIKLSYTSYNYILRVVKKFSAPILV